MNLAKLSFATLALSASAIPAAAHAAPLLFQLSGGRNLAFQLDSNPVPDSSQTFLGEQTVFLGLVGSLNGTPITFDTISFGTGIFAPLSITAPGLDFTQFAGGGPLFTGPGSAPVFATGTFDLTNPFFPDSNSTLTISAIGGAVPEPAAWGMLVLGFGALGFAMRRTRAAKTAVSYA